MDSGGTLWYKNGIQTRRATMMLASTAAQFAKENDG